MTNERYNIMPAGLIHQFTTSFRLALTLVLLAGALGIATLAPTRSAVAQTAGSGSAVIEIDAAGCNTDAAINAAIGQSFKLPSAAALKLDNISIWIGPAQDRETSYELALLRGEGPMGSLLKTSSIVKLGGGEQARWHGFTFSGVTLQPGPSYTFVLVSRSSVSGTFAQCKDKYPDGSLHRPVEGRDSSADVAFKIFGVSTAATDQIALPLPPPPAPGEPAQVLPPKIAELAAKGLLGAKRTVMPLGDSITDMPAGVDPNDWAGPAWGGYRKKMANNGVFNALFQLVGSYGVYQYQSTASPWPPTMPGDQRSHCGWSGATMDGYTIPPATSNISPGTSIIGNF